MPKNWNRRFKHNRDKMKTGDIFELAEVVRNLSLRDHEKGLSTGEKQMFVKAKKILASELMYAKDMDEDEAAEWLEGVLARGGKNEEERNEGRRDRLTIPCPSGPFSPRPVAASGSASDRPKAFARLGERPLLAESLERLEARDWIERDRRRRAARVGGAGDPARRGARLRQGQLGRDRRRDRGPSPCGWRARGRS